MKRVKNLVLGIGIIIVFALVLWQGVETFYPSPQYNDFCDFDFPRPPPLNAETTLTQEPDFKECQDQYDNARDSHSKIVFFIALIVGIITIIIGYTILSIEPVGSSLIGSGIWAIFWGTVVNWRNFANVGRFILLLIALVLLIWLTIKLNTPKKKGFLNKIGIK